MILAKLLLRFLPVDELLFLLFHPAYESLGGGHRSRCIAVLYMTSDFRLQLTELSRQQYSSLLKNFWFFSITYRFS